MSRQSNLAYDLSRFEEQAPARQQQAKPVVLSRTRQQASPFKYLLFAGLAAAVCCLLLYSKAQVSELHNRINASTAELEQIRSDGVRMQSEMDSKLSLKNVEDYAVNVLGLQKVNKGQVEYITLETDSAVTLKDQEDDNVFVSIHDRFTDILEYMGF